MARHAVDEHQRQFGQRAHVDIDHRQLFVATERRRGAAQTKAGIVDDNRRLQALRRKLRGDYRRGIATFEIHGDHGRAGTTAPGDIIGQRVEPVLPPRHESQLMAVRGEHFGQGDADAGRCAGNEGDRFHGASPPIPTRRSSSKARAQSGGSRALVSAPSFAG